MTTLEETVSKYLGTTSIKIGKHSISFVDTTEAWNKLLESVSYRGVDNTKKSDNATNVLQSNLENEASQISAEDIKEYNILPEYARYNYYYALPQGERNCYFCRKVFRARATRGDTDKLTCRICHQLFHEECVSKRGYSKDEISRIAISECSTSVIGWSCPRCEDIFGLLSEDEKEEISDLFDRVSGDDKVIDIDEFIGQRKEEYRKLVDAEMTVAREQQEREMFYAIDQDNSGFIDRWEFYPYMAIRYISRRKSSEIIGMLTPREVDCFREYFKSMDTKMEGFISQFDARRAYVKWYTSKVRPCQDKYVDYTWYGGPKENTLLIILKLKMSNTVKAEDELTITWEQYLKICALHIISARINTVSKRPKIPPMPIYLYSQSACMCYLEDQI